MWTLGTLIAFPLFAILGLALVILGVLLLRTAGTGYDASDQRIFGWISLVLGVLIAICVALGMFPYKAEYHRWETKAGTVTRIDKRLVGSGDGMEEKFVVTLGEGQQQYGCLDTRCASIHEGDYLALACKKVFEYGATDGWDCKFREWRDQT